MEIGFRLDAGTRSRLRAIKQAVAGMLLERGRLEGLAKQSALPSEYWSGFCSYFSYMLDLSEESLSKIRLHTYHLTGDTYQRYYFRVEESALRTAWEALTKRTPRSDLLAEPAGGFGLEMGDGRRINWDIYRAQFVLNALRQGWVERNDSTSSRHAFLEIGGGYGSMAYHLSRTLGSPRYFLVDLPETLLFAASYLAMVCPDKSLYLYSPGDELPSLGANGPDFLLVPNYRLDLLNQMRFDLVINVASLQEMRQEQVVTYLDFIQRACDGVFLSSNQDRQPRNSELQSLSELLRARFSLQEVTTLGAPSGAARARAWLRTTLRGAATMVGLASPPEVNLLNAIPYRTYLCRPIEGKLGPASRTRSTP